ncbi:MAG TPA: 2-oxo acid dehydrogenase subunit E2 [Sandaracinaceae bacterium LLY-WYZ-13_1]|nr:2-oxo acid dehydrogenase subunit E2 [Sandaracinaceae bacterium LLY-WYZ-13_1]
MRRRRSDARRVEGLSGNRRIMPFLMRGKNESAVLFEHVVDLEHTLPWLEARDAHLFPLLLAALARTLHDHPRLNRYVAGRRHYQRDEVSIAFAMKPRFDERSDMSVLREVFPADETFDALRDRLDARLAAGRKGTRSRSDREADLLTRLPVPLLDAGVRLFRALDALGLAPRSMVRPDPMHASVFVANLGSLGLDAAWHHLYEYGTCPIFATLGRIQRLPVVVDDRVEARRAVRLRYTYDERIEDGFYAARALEGLRRRLEDPASWLDG